MLYAPTWTTGPDATESPVSQQLETMSTTCSAPCSLLTCSVSSDCMAGRWASAVARHSSSNECRSWTERNGARCWNSNEAVVSALALLAA